MAQRYSALVRLDAVYSANGSHECFLNRTVQIWKYLQGAQGAEMIPLNLQVCP